MLAQAGLAGLACREGDVWAVRATADAPGTAGSASPAPILAAVEGMIAGEPLDATQAAAARARGWRE